MTSSASISVTALPVILIWMYIGRTYRLWCSPACSKSSWAQSRRRPSPSEERPPRRWTGTRWWRSLSVLCSRKASALQCEHMSWWSKEKKVLLCTVLTGAILMVSVPSNSCHETDWCQNRYQPLESMIFTSTLTKWPISRKKKTTLNLIQIQEVVTYKIK